MPTTRLTLVRLWISCAAVVAACGRAPSPEGSTPSAVAAEAAAPPSASAPVPERSPAPGTAPSPAPVSAATAAAPPAPPALSPLADSIANYLVFAPVGEQWFVAAVRNKKLLLDIGRVDTEVRRDSARASAFRAAVARRSTVPLGTTFMLRSVRGEEEVTAAAVTTWNARIVLELKGSDALDSLVRATPTLVAIAHRELPPGVVAANVLSRPPGSVPVAPTAALPSNAAASPTVRSAPQANERANVSTAPPAAAGQDSCDRVAPFSADLTARLASRLTLLRDSLDQAIRTGTLSPYERLRKGMSTHATQQRGCFGGARRIALLVSVRAGDVEWARERLVLVDTLGRATSLRVNDYRFRAHDLLSAFDANGDGVDDLAVRSTTQRSGGTSVLGVDMKTRRAVRLSVGFVWENF